MKRILCMMMAGLLLLTLCGCQGKTPAPDTAATVHKALLPIYEQFTEKQQAEDTVRFVVEPTENTLADDVAVTATLLELLRLDEWEALAEEPTAPPYSGQRVYRYEAENGVSFSIGLWYGAVTEQDGATQYYALPQEANGELARAIREYAHKAEDAPFDDERLTTAYLLTYLEEKQQENQQVTLFSVSSANQLSYDVPVTQDVIDMLRLDEWQPIAQVPTDWQAQYTHRLQDGVRFQMGERYVALVSEADTWEMDDENGAVAIVTRERDVQYFELPQETAADLAAAIAQQAQSRDESE